MCASDEQPTDLYGTARVSSAGGKVLVDGAQEAQKCHFSVNCLNGDRVMLRVIDHKLVVIANLTNPNISVAEVITHVQSNPNTGVVQNVVISDSTLQDVDLHGFFATDGTIANTKISGGTIDGATLTGIPYASITNLEAETASIADARIAQATISQAQVENLAADYATITSLNAATARIGDLEADHVSVSDFQAEQANIDHLQADTADIGTIRANAAKVQNLTAAELEADHAAIGSLDANYAHITQGVIDNATIGYADVNGLSANYAQANMANVNNAWITSGTIKDGAITNAMINSVSANKLTAGTIDASNITVTNLNADNITAGTLNGQRIGTGSLSLDKLAEDVYTESEIDTIVDGLNDRIDGAIETWTGTDVPTLNNAPASGWTTDAAKDTHVGDVYFVVNSQSQQDGYNYRFTKSGTGSSATYSWQLIKDSDVTAALSRLTTIEAFDTEVSAWKTATDTELTQARGSYTSLKGRIEADETAISTKVETSTFNTLSNTVDSNTASITSLSTIAENNGLTSSTNITNTVNTVSQTANANSSKITSLTTTLGTNADGTTKTGDIVHRTSAVEQDLSGFKTTVSATYATKDEAAITKSASGNRTLVTEDAAELPLLTLDALGECVQDGTPTPESPVHIQAVRPRNLANPANVVENAYVSNTIASASGHYVYYVPCEPNTTYTIAKTMRVAEDDKVYDRFSYAYTKEMPAIGVTTYGVVAVQGSDSTIAFSGQRLVRTMTTGDDAKYIVVWVGYSSSAHGAFDNAYSKVQVELGSAGHDYTPYGCIGVSVHGKNYLNAPMFDAGDSSTYRGVTYTRNANGSITANGTATGGDSWYIFASSSAGKYDIGLEVGSTYTLSCEGAYARLYNGTSTLQGQNSYTFTFGQWQVWNICVAIPKGTTVSNLVIWPMLERGSTATSYESYWQRTSYLDMQGNELYALDSTYKDELRIDSAGHAVIEKRVGKQVFDGSENWLNVSTDTSAWNYLVFHPDELLDSYKGTTSAYELLKSNLAYGAAVVSTQSGNQGKMWTRFNQLHIVPSATWAGDGTDKTAWNTFLASNPMTFLYPLDPSYWNTIDLGYIDLPTVADGSTVHVEAEIQPVIGGSWWTQAGSQVAGLVQVAKDDRLAASAMNPFVAGTQTVSTRFFTGVCSELTSLTDGQQITYWLPYASKWETAASKGIAAADLPAETVTNGYSNDWLKLTLADGSETPWIACYYGGTTRLTTHYAANNAIRFVYRESVGTVGAGWWADSNYDTNTTYSKYSASVVAGLNGIKRYSLCMRDANGNITSVVNQDNNTAKTGKTCYTGGLMLGSVFYTTTNAVYAAGANAGDIWESYGGVDFRYSVNGVENASTTELQMRKPVYFVGTIGTGGLFYLDTTKWWTQEPDDTSKVYVLVGTAYSSYYAIFVAADNPAYVWDGTKLVERTDSRVTIAETKIEQTENNVLIQATRNDTTAAQGGQHLIQSLINVAPSGVTIDAAKVNIEGAALFTSGRLSSTSLDAAYDANGAAATAKSEAISAAASDATSKANAAQAAAISAAATDATNKANAANAQEQLIYKTAANGTTSMSGTTTWVTDTTGNQATWTIRHPEYSQSYPVLFVATQRKTVGGTVTCTTPLIDDTTTVIDGGRIITGSVTATQIDATNLHVNAANIDGQLLVGDISGLQSALDAKASTTDLAAKSKNFYPGYTWTLTEDSAPVDGKVYYTRSSSTPYTYTEVTDPVAASMSTYYERGFATPAPPYSVGDTWIQGDGGDVLVCVTAKASGASFAQSDWEVSGNAYISQVADGLMSEIQDNRTAVDEYIAATDTALGNLETVVAGKADVGDVESLEASVNESLTTMQADIGAKASADDLADEILAREASEGQIRDDLQAKATQEAVVAVQNALDNFKAVVQGNAAFVNSDDLTGLLNYITIETEGGSPVMTMGSSSSRAKSVQTNTALQFQFLDDNGTWSSVASIEADENGQGILKATNAIVVSDLRFGKWAWFTRGNGNLSVKWMGE